MSYIGRSYEELWDSRSVRVDNTKTFAYEAGYNQQKGKDNGYTKSSIRGRYEKSLLNQLYYSDKNIQKVKNRVRYRIWQMSDEQFVIDIPQETNLVEAMQGVFNEYAKHSPDNIAGQINELDNLVVDKIAPKILSNVKQYLKYLEDANEPYRLQELPQSTTSKGTKTLEISTALGFGNENFENQPPQVEMFQSGNFNQNVNARQTNQEWHGGFR